MQDLESLRRKYNELEWTADAKEESMIDPAILLTFRYDYSGSDATVVIDTDEFTAVCPWTQLPDFGTLSITYVPFELCLELKSLKYYLLTFRDVGIVQEHAANKILKDLVEVCNPHSMNLILDYRTRGGLHTVVTVNYPNSNV